MRDDEEIPQTRQHSLPPARRSTLVLTEAQMRGEEPIEGSLDAAAGGYATLEDPDDDELSTQELALEGVPLFEEEEATLPRLRPEPYDEAAEIAETAVRDLPEPPSPPGRPQMTRAVDLGEFDSPSIIGRPPAKPSGD